MATGGARGSAANPAIVKRREGIELRVRVQPRSSRNAVDGLRGDRLRLRVTAPPVEGAANRAVVDLLARQLGVPRRRIHVLAGATAREKTVFIEGLDEEIAARKLGVAKAGAATGDEAKDKR